MYLVDNLEHYFVDILYFHFVQILFNLKKKVLLLPNKCLCSCIKLILKLKIS